MVEEVIIFVTLYQYRPGVSQTTNMYPRGWRNLTEIEEGLINVLRTCGLYLLSYISTILLTIVLKTLLQDTLDTVPKCFRQTDWAMGPRNLT